MEGTPQSARSKPPNDVIADCFREGTVIPFLGAAASYVGVDPQEVLPGGAQLAERFRNKLGETYPGPASDPLTKVTQYIEDEQGDRDYLLAQIAAIFYDGVAPEYMSSVIQFLMNIRPEHVPPLIITTNYDPLIERVLIARGIPFLCVSHIIRGTKAGRFLCYEKVGIPYESSNILTQKEVDERLIEIDDETPDRTVILYKMHGTSQMKCSKELALQLQKQQRIDSVVLTETDYIDFLARDFYSRMPISLLDRIRKNRLLFLGYSLMDWNFRVLLRRLESTRTTEAESKRAWAILKNSDEVEAAFWRHRGVSLYNYSLASFLSELQDLL
jgi:hypothetical protein